MIFKKYQRQIVNFVLGSISAGFVALTILIIIFPHSFVDLKFSQEMQEHQNPFLDATMKTASWFGYFPGSAIVVLGGTLLFFIFKYRREALYVFLTSLSGLVSSVIKLLVNRPRPTSPDVRIVQKVYEQSFPSGHVLFYIVFFGFLIVLMYQLKTIGKVIRISVASFSALLIFAIPFSRIYLGAHWFTDVLGGFLLGMLCLYLLCIFYFRKTAANKQKAKS
ncbi:phosphatase PAP2 family protein [Mucilaginibacter gotjawali]|uniref:Undecaprenyl-diphosphatase n=2 Tax=Mucilaginibacter gotjawali TaxID=1550579 RepID=A0A839SLS2_9SPHI|nr:phosphatase PAP2 family protein [Mucilaginibacter gotjawali]MBB3057790.1 undecaprenyl-diphosphatase [Mucilaginibacter gotjawali]BAU52592.1 undecaprenyl pyrophosphate phosphatase [Mucilaginibacter gotjawali]